MSPTWVASSRICFICGLGAASENKVRRSGFRATNMETHALDVPFASSRSNLIKRKLQADIPPRTGMAMQTMRMAIFPSSVFRDRMKRSLMFNPARWLVDAGLNWLIICFIDKWNADMIPRGLRERYGPSFPRFPMSQSRDVGCPGGVWFPTSQNRDIGGPGVMRGSACGDGNCGWLGIPWA